MGWSSARWPVLDAGVDRGRRHGGGEEIGRGPRVPHAAQVGRQVAQCGGDGRPWRRLADQARRLGRILAAGIARI